MKQSHDHHVTVVCSLRATQVCAWANQRYCGHWTLPPELLEEVQQSVTE